MINNPQDLLRDLFDTAVNAANPHAILPQYLPKDTSGRAVVVGAGKAAASMAAALEAHWQGPLSGLVVTRYGHGETTEFIEVVEAAHPVPDDAGEAVAKRIMELVSDLTCDDTVICLISGGGSALLSLPALGIKLADKQSINKALLRCGASISEINCVRKHLSAIKGGRLAKACYPAPVHTYAISDVPGDEATVIASGPTVSDPTTSAQALEILSHYQIDVPAPIAAWLASPASETLKDGDPALKNNRFTLIATPQHALAAAAKKAENYQLSALVLGDKIEGESSEIAKMHGAIALQITDTAQPIKPPCIILSGGETTVTLKGDGRGGRNAEFLLSLCNTLQGHQQIYALAADTDGIDGSEDNAGAILTPNLFKQAKAKGLDPAVFLANNDGYGFFKSLDRLIITGPTRTNVNDFRAILVLDK